jgi:hypothetical protein
MRALPASQQGVVTTKGDRVNKLLVALSVLVLWPLSLRGDGVAQFDTVTGEGFVPKSVIQVAFDLSNGQLKRMSDSVSFAFAEKDTLVVNCKNGHTLEAFVEFGSNVGSTLAYGKGQFVGFDLTGFVDPEWVKDPPAADTFCPGGTFGQTTERRFTLSAVLGDETIVILGGGITP